MKQTTFNFKAQFAPLVVSGSKTSTIRMFANTQPPVPGDVLKLFTGMRQPTCRRLRVVKCCRVEPIEIGEHHINLDGVIQSPRALDILAMRDGFDSVAELRAFFRETYGLPVRATWVSWA